VGTVSIAKSEVFSSFLKKAGVPHNVLNAKQHQREADIVAQAGRRGAVTISTNMAGRGTDILLGGNPELAAKAEVGPPPEPPPPPAEGEVVDPQAHEKALAEHQARFEAALAKTRAQCEQERKAVVDAGGLFVLGTERHESRRIDNQLRGRSGRQGDAGVSRFYLSLEDDLMRIFGSERIQGLMERLGMEEGEVIEHRWLSKAIENAQKRVEGHNFDIRKNLLEYDDVMNQQRKTIYRLRRKVLGAGAGIPVVEYTEDKKTRAKIRSEENFTLADLKEMVLDAIEDVIVGFTDTFASSRNPTAWDLEALGRSVKETFNIEMTFQQNGRPEDLQEQIYKVVEKVFLDREKAYGEEWLRFCQLRYLSTIDQLWKDHLLAMDHLRQGIGLRGYGQKDPKLEYKREGYDGFVKMLAAIQVQFISQIIRAQPTSAQEAHEDSERIARQLEKSRRAAVEGRAGEDGKAEPVAAKQVVREGPKVGRNDPCPCGSGKKYKKCHGADAHP
jgi:preprotein translocase subunit SecA